MIRTLMRILLIIIAVLMILLGSNSAVSAFIAIRNIDKVPDEGEHYTVNNTRIFVRNFGSGDPMLIIHGLSSSGFTFIEIAELLSAERKVYLLDLPGLGLSGISVNCDYSIISMARTISELIVLLGVSSIDLMGHGFGGEIALTIAREYPQSVRSVIVVNPSIPASNPPLPEWLLSKKRLSKMLLKHVFGTYPFERSVAGQKYHNTDSFDSERFLLEFSLSYWTSSDTIIDYYHSNKDYAPEEQNTIRRPVLIIQGAEDTLSPTDRSQELNTILRNSMLVVMDNCAHFPMYENQSAFLNHVKSFLRSVR